MTKKKPKASSAKTKVKMTDVQMASTAILENITTLHGTNYFAVKKGRSLVLWSILMVANITMGISFVLIIKDRYNSDQIVTKIYSDWSVDKVPFPAISICNFNLVSLNASRNVEKILRKYNVSQKRIETFFHDLFYLKDYNVGRTSVKNHSEILNILKGHFYDMEDIMEEVHQTCENLLVYCEFNGKQKQCVDMFSLIQTKSGHCCMFNYNGVNVDSDPLKIEDDDFDYYDDEGVKTSIVATSQSGSSSGLRVVFNVEPSDYASWAQAPAYGAEIMLTDPNDFPETRVVYRYMTIGEALDVKVEPKIFQCQDNLRSVKPTERGCWFHDEVSLLYTDRYSFETCYTECRIRSYLNYCHCIPYKYPIESLDEEVRICELADLPCLNYMIVNWEKTKIKCVPECLKECRDKEYSVITDTVPLLSEFYPKHIMKGRNISELAALKVYYIKSTCNCYMMSLLIDMNTFIATYGGLFSLFFGGSVITVFELVYLFFSSFVKMMLRYKSKKDNVD